MTRNYKIDNLRSIAIISVVLGHSIILYSSTWNIYESSNSCIFLDYLHRVINIYQMPLFFSISGYLMAASVRSKSLFCFTISKIKRLLIPFLAIGILYMIPIKILIHHPSYVGKGFKNAILMLITGTEVGHLWFLPTLFFIFLISYFIFYFSKYSHIILPICFVASFALHFFAYKISFFIMPYQSYVFYYLWSFLLGAIINKYPRIENASFFRYIIAIASAISVIISLFFDSITIISSLITVIALYNIVPNSNNKFCQKLSANSFGIYLLHSPLIYITFSFFLNKPPLLIIFINFVLWSSVAFILTELLNKSKIRFIIGSNSQK